VSECAVLRSTAEWAERYASSGQRAVLSVGKRLFEMDYHVQKVREIQQKYGSRVEVVWLHDDDWFTLASLDPNLTVEDMMSEFGLTPLDDYRARATVAIDKARAAAATKAKPAN